jgi:low affinity Fe/Cu permease
MSFQAYLDNIEKQTGKTPNDFIALAHAKGFEADTKAGEIIAWLKEDFKLGHGRAMAMMHVIKHGPKISDKHVGSGGSHADPSDTLRLDGIENR